MANWLRDVFSNDNYELGGKLYFRDNESYANFLKALDAVHDEGKAVEIKDVSAFSTDYTRGSVVYPLQARTEVGSVTIGPPWIPIQINTLKGQRTVKFKKYKKGGATVLETEDDAIIYQKISHICDSTVITFSYRMQYQYAKNIEEIVESLCIALGVMDFFFRPDEVDQVNSDFDALLKMRKSFEVTYAFFERLSAIGHELCLTFDPRKIGDIDGNIQEVDELYVMLVLKRIIRPNWKIIVPESPDIILDSTNDMPEIGSNLEMTFVRELEYSIFGELISVYTANLISNVVVKDIIFNETGSVKLLYGSDDSKPMYISCAGFKTKDDATNEVKLIMEKKEHYVNALTTADYLNSNDTVSF